MTPGILRASELGLPISGNVFCMPAIANYLGGDITSGLLMTDLDTREDLALFLDIGTNGELVLGCREFLLMGAGAAGPRLRALSANPACAPSRGAICSIKIGSDNRLRYETIGNLPPKGICGSGILDLIAEGFLSGWIDSAGNLQKSASPNIRDVWDDMRQRNVPAIIYAYDGKVPLYFTQDDIGEFLTCKAAAHTMVATLLESVNVSPSEIGTFYLAGGFGTHYNLESAITVGLYPDLPRENLKSSAIPPLRAQSACCWTKAPGAAESDSRTCDLCAVRRDGKIRGKYAGSQIPAAHGRVALSERKAALLQGRNIQRFYRKQAESAPTHAAAQPRESAS